MSFHEQLLERARAIWEKLLAHPFLAQTADGTIPDETFANWMKQDYKFVEAAVPFLSVLAAKSPARFRRGLSEAVAAIHQELQLFERMASGRGVELAGVEMSPTCHAYVQFLLATAYGRPFAEGFAVLYGAEKAYLDSWSRVQADLKADSPWKDFIDNWTSEAFHNYVDWLAETLDELAESSSPPRRERMTELFLLTGQYEILFWEMAAGGEGWPVPSP